MAKMTRCKTKYPGVFFRIAERVGGSGLEKIYYIVFKRDGKTVETKAGRQYMDDMTPAKAANMRAEILEGKQPTRKEAREARAAAKAAEQARPTLARLLEAYRQSKPDRNWATDMSLFAHYLETTIGDKTPSEIRTADMDAIRTRMLKAGKSPQTTKHALALAKRIIRFGVKRGLTPMPDPSRLYIEFPNVDNVKTEVLTPEQTARLLAALDEEDDPFLTALVRLALCTGMRRGALLGLKWEDLDFEHGFILLQGTFAKKKRSGTIPMNDQAMAILRSIPRTGSPFVFPGKNPDKPRIDINRFMRRIKEKAELPDDFRPLHGLRHSFASYLASSGQVSMYELQKLLTHESPQMTQRYAHLHDDALRRASGVASVIFEQAATAKKQIHQTELAQNRSENLGE